MLSKLNSLYEPKFGGSTTIKCSNLILIWNLCPQTFSLAHVCKKLIKANNINPLKWINPCFITQTTFLLFLKLWKRRTWFIVTMYFKEKSPKPFTKCEHGYKNRFTREWKEHLLCNSSRSVIKYDGPRACMKKHCCAKKTKLSRNFRQFVAFNRKMFESMRTDEKQKKREYLTLLTFHQLSICESLIKILSLLFRYEIDFDCVLNRTALSL